MPRIPMNFSLLRTSLFLVFTVVACCFAPSGIAQCTFQGPDLGADTTLCPGNNLLLSLGNGFNSVQWQNGSTSSFFNVTGAGQYHYVATSLSTNLIQNGDFEQGNTGFTTDYTLGSGGAFGPLSSEGEYEITTSPNLAHINFSTCGDHTSGTGNMMVVNGATTPGTNVWCQTVSVTPNTDYQFSSWVSNALNDLSVSLLQFSINGVEVGNVFSPSVNGCVWQNFSTVWNSGTDTTALICLVNQNTGGGGNDFMLDDIHFSSLCYARDTINVANFPAVNAELGPNQFVCEGDTVILNVANPGASYAWSTFDTVAELGITVPGTYGVVVTSADGCTQEDSVNIAFNSFPTPDLGNDTLICSGEDLTLAPGSTNFSYLWNDNSLGTSLTVNAAGTYSVTVDNQGCTAADTIEVSVAPPIPIALGNDTVICVGASVLLDAGSTGLTYLWSDNSTGNTLEVNTPGTVSLTVSQGNCMISESIEISNFPQTLVDLGPDQNLCTNSTLALDATLAGATHLWSDSSSNSTLTVSAGGTYWVQITDGNQCVQSDTLTVTPITPATIDLGSDVALCIGESLVLDATVSGGTYTWQDGSNQATFLATESGTYSVAVNTACGVINDAIEVTFENCLVLLTFPNVFSPNGDFLNDRFLANNLEGVADGTITILDRWGKNVYESSTFEEGWDGQFKGNDCAEGTYFWVVQYTDRNGEGHNLSGVLTLLR